MLIMKGKIISSIFVFIFLFAVITAALFYKNGYRVKFYDAKNFKYTKINLQSLNCNQSFDPQTWDSCNHINFKLDTFLLPDVEYSKLPYVLGCKKEKVYSIYDAEGIPLHNYYRGDKLNYHPVFLAQVGLKQMDIYNTTNKRKALRDAYKIYRKLIDVSLKLDSSIFFPYTFAFPLHGCDQETMMSPWYSGMAQGQTLSFFCRLYEATKDKEVLNQCEKVFNSFTRLKGQGFNPWVSCVDKDGYLWLEEYPRDLPAFTLNGMIFAIYGLYDFYRITESELALKYVYASLTTIKDNILRFRCEDDVSYYCLKHNNFKGRNPSYHKVHINELKKLTEITGDSYFEEIAEIFYKDTEGKENLKVH